MNATITAFQHTWGRFSAWFLIRFWHNKSPVTKPQQRIPRPATKTRHHDDMFDDIDPNNLTHKQNEEIMTHYRDLQSLLTDLDAVFSDLKKLTPRGHQAQKIVQRYGPFVMDVKSGGPIIEDGVYYTTLEAFKAYGFPSFLISYRRENRTEEFVQQFTLAIKSKSCPYRRKMNGSVYYEMCIIILPYGEHTKPLEFSYYIEIDKKTGQVSAIPSPQVEQKIIPSKKHPRDPTVITTKKVSFADFRNDYVIKRDKENHETIGSSDTCDYVKTHLEQSFMMTYNLVMRREYGVNIIAKKGKLRATFIVPSNRWKTFFKERIGAKSSKTGRNLPIFHAVVAHKRETKTKTAYVKTHYRGLRHFYWGDYEISIVMQGKHGVSQAHLGLSSELEETYSGGVSPTGFIADQFNHMFETGRTIRLSKGE